MSEMKRMCAMVVNHQPKGDMGYISFLLDCWEKAGVQTFVVAEDPALGRILGRKTGSGIDRAVAYAKSEQVQEIILMTQELMGPVFPLDEILTRMDSCQGEIWQLVRGACMYGIPQQHWQSIPDADHLFEIEPQRELYDTSDLTEVTKVPLLDKPITLVRDRGCPFFQHEVFHRNYSDVITTTLGHQGQVFYNWLYRERGWNVDLLWDYLLVNCHQQEYFQNLHLNYVLPVKDANHRWVQEHLKTHKVALVMHLYYPDKLAESCSFAMRFPKQTHLIITTSDEQKKAKILEVFSGKEFASLDVRVIENRGRDVSSLLVGAAEVFDAYDYVCFFHDKKTLQTKPGSIGAGFAYKLQENLFASSDFVCNVISLFANNHRLGMISPPAPHHGDYFFTLGTDWGPNYQKTRKLARDLGFRAPISEKFMPVTALGTCFWFRGKALKPLSDHHWRYDEFPPEPNNADGTILHAIERIYSFACVEAGYYPAFVMSDRYAALEYSSLRYYVREFNNLCLNHGIMSYHRNMCQMLSDGLKQS